jgi:HemK-related putative methylase
LPFSFRKKLLYVLNNNIRTNSFLTKLLFGVKISGRKRIHWDFTTLLLKKCLSEITSPNKKILEIGTGAYAILSIFLKKKFGCEINACDVNDEYIISSKQTLKNNNTSFKIFKSNLFENVEGKYDIIFFNAVYIPEETGKRLGLDNIHKFKTDWCGGAEGNEVIERFLKDSILHIKNDGVIILGVNYLYLDKILLNDKIYKYKIKVIKQFSSKINPSSILLLKKI